MAWFRTDPQEVLKETVLWENSAPTSAMAGGYIMNLSDDINNYDYLKFKYRHSTTNSNLYEIIVPVDLYKTSLTPDSGNTTHYLPSMSVMNGGQYAFANIYARAIPYKTDTSIEISSVRSLNGTTIDTTYIIPTQIIGIKRGIDVNPVLDLSLPPDAMYQNTLSNGATYTLAVTQKPKYVVLILKDSASSSAGSGYLFGIVNVETGVGYRYGYWSSAFRNDVWTNWNSYITSITDNSVTIANVYGTACYTTVGAYY